MNYIRHILLLITTVSISVNALEVNTNNLSEQEIKMIEKVEFEVKFIESRNLHEDLHDLSKNYAIIIVSAKTKQNLGKRLLSVNAELKINKITREFLLDFMLVDGKAISIHKLDLPYHPKLKCTKIIIKRTVSK